jgi:hypothetical protein
MRNPFIAAQGQRERDYKKDSAERDGAVLFGAGGCWGLYSLTVARGKSSHRALFAETVRPQDSPEATKPQSDCSPSPVREKDTKPYPKD